jgi:hypothetical protein
MILILQIILLFKHKLRVQSRKESQSNEIRSTGKKGRDLGANFAQKSIPFTEKKGRTTYLCLQMLASSSLKEIMN